MILLRNFYLRYHGDYEQFETVLALEETVKIILDDNRHPAYQYVQKYRVDFDFTKKLYKALTPIKQIIRVFDKKDAPQQVISHLDTFSI